LKSIKKFINVIRWLLLRIVNYSLTNRFNKMTI
jgi:hypothetical protein